MFYDTTILANADLTTAAGKEYFYVNVRDFYSRIPPRYWAAIDNKPIVWLYDTIWISALRPIQHRLSLGALRPGLRRACGCSSCASRSGRQSKGVEPPTPVTSDGLYAWGAAPFGFNTSPELTIAEVGPGFKNTAVLHGRARAELLRHRPRGRRLLRATNSSKPSQSGRHILAAETWNEFSEGTDIQETVETGRQYIDLTRRYVDQFKALVGRRGAVSGSRSCAPHGASRWVQRSGRLALHRGFEARSDVAAKWRYRDADYDEERHLGGRLNGTGLRNFGPRVGP